MKKTKGLFRVLYWRNEERGSGSHTRYFFIKQNRENLMRFLIEKFYRGFIKNLHFQESRNSIRKKERLLTEWLSYFELRTAYLGF